MKLFLATALGWLCTGGLLLANLPGGGNGTGPNVTLTDGGSTVTLNNGIVSIVVTKADASIHTINYTFNNTGTPQTQNLLAGGNNGGQLYWTGNPASFGNMSFTESVVSNITDYAEINLLSTTTTNGTMEVHYSMLRGSTGFYTTAILNHRAQDTNVGIVLRPNIYSGAMFNWMSVDAARNRLMEVSGGSAIAVQGAPKECTLWTNGIYAGQYEDKYKYSAMLGLERVWGWSSVGSGGANVGLWNVSGSVEEYPGGPMERSLMEHIGTTVLNVFTGGYYGFSTDNNIVGGETWSKVYGPYFYYFNNVTNTLTGTNAPAQALYSDALAQAAAEATAWPYSWFVNTNYTPATNRGTVTGKMVISDSGNPNASAGGLWVGVVQQPSPAVDTIYDFQQWCRPYEFWVQTDTNGNFAISNVIAGANYTLHAFGPGAAGTFMSQNQTGGNPPLLYNLPASPFSVTVTAGATNNLGTVTWTPTRVGATVFEIGQPDRTAAKFRHGDDYWVGDIGPNAAAPSPIWSKWLEYPLDFPNDVNYTVGQSRWSTDWNFCQPVVTDSAGNYNTSASTITFNLPSTPANGATASIYLGLCSDYYGAIIVSVNNVNAASLSGLSASPNNSVPSTGYYTAYGSSDTTIREGNNGAFTDERLTFAASALHAGANTINITFRQIGGSYFANHFMYDYLRLELTGYVPPPPAGVTAWAGNNNNLVAWPVVPGATAYNVLRSTTSGSGYVSVTNGVTGPVCGSGAVNATWLDNTAGNGTNYYYVVRAVNPTGSSASSSQSPAAMPSAGNSATPPPAPSGLAVSGVAHQSVTLNWGASPGANFYSLYRSTLCNNGGGASNVLSTILLDNSLTNTTYVDASPTDGAIYRYSVTATSAGGTSSNSAPAVGVSRPTAPAAAPLSLTANFVATTNISLTWTAVPGAIGYVISRATSSGGPYTFLQTVTETTYTDVGLNPAVVYYYRVAAMNVSAVSGNNTDAVNSQQTYPASLTATATNAQVTLNWSSVSNATSYTLKRGTSVGAETFTVVTGYSGTRYTNTALANGTTYYYVVTATGAGGTSGNSPEASATPLAAGNGIWISGAGGNWSTATNWQSGAIASGAGSTADFSTLSLSANPTVTLDSTRTVSDLIFGDTAAAFNWSLAGSNTLTLGTGATVDVVNRTASISTPVAGANGLTKTGAGSLVLGGATNSITGGVTVNGGSVTLDYSAANSPVTNLVPAANALTLGGGALQITGGSNAASGQTFNGLTLNKGASAVTAAPVSGANLPTVTLGAITENVGGTVEFTGPATINSNGTVAATATITTTTIAGTGGVLGGMGLGKNGAYATVGLYDWATTNSLASPYTIVGGSQVPGFYQTTSVASAGNYDVNSGGVNTVGNAAGATTLRFNQNAAFTVNNTAFTYQNCQGILVTPNCGAHNEAVSGTSLEFYRSTSGGASYGVIWQNNPSGYLTFAIELGHGRQAGQDNGLVQSGPGTVVYSGVNTYELGAWLNGGFSVVTAYTGFGQTNNGYNTVSSVTLNGGTVVGNATFTNSQSGVNARPFVLASNGGGLAATAGNTMTVDGVVSDTTGAGPLTIGIPAAAANNFTAGLLPGTGPGTANTTPVYATGTVTLTAPNTYTGGTVLQSGTLDINGAYALGGAFHGGVTFHGGTLQYATNISGANGPADLSATGPAGVTLAAGGGTIDLNGNAVTYSDSIGNGGTGSLVVESSLPGGVLNLSGANNYSGATTVSNATLSANNSSGSATGSGSVLVENQGVLAGAGAVAGSVTVASGGAIAPGGFNALGIGGNLTLATGVTTTLGIQRSPASNAAVNVTGTLTEGGTLIVTNLGNSNFAAGDHFQLFSASGISGAFATVVLPPISGGSLVWDTSQLAVDGSVWVVSTLPTTITQAAVVDTNLVLNGIGGTPGWNYYVLAATNPALPLASWDRVATNQFDGTGNCNALIPLDPQQPQLFYRLQVP